MFATETPKATLKAASPALTKDGIDNRLLPRPVQFEREDSGVSLEIGVGGKDGPVAGDGDGTDEDVGNGDCHSLDPALVAGFGGGFIVRGGDRLIGEGTQHGAQLFVLAGRLDAG